MHDPDVVAFAIPRPWPRLGRARPGPRWRLAWRLRPAPGSPAQAEAIATGRSPFPWWRPGSWVWRPIVAGRPVWFPALVTVWHREPGGKDSGAVCRHYVRWHDGAQWRTRVTNGWRWHIHHWRVQVSVLQRLRRRLLTRCEWCGGRSTRRAPVNVSGRWDRERGRWWRGERGLFHVDCSAVEAAHAACLCAEPPMRDHGWCVRCGKQPSSRDVGRLRLFAEVPRGRRVPGLLEREPDQTPAGEPSPPARGLAALRYAVAVQAGHEWCFEHQRPRWGGYDPCAPWHPDPVRRPGLVWCLTCQLLHGPLDWDDDCEPEVAADAADDA